MYLRYAFVANINIILIPLCSYSAIIFLTFMIYNFNQHRENRYIMKKY